MYKIILKSYKLITNIETSYTITEVTSNEHEIQDIIEILSQHAISEGAYNIVIHIRA
jgi:hypothetical protein